MVKPTSPPYPPFPHTFTGRRFVLRGGAWDGRETYLPENTKTIEVVSPDGLLVSTYTRSLDSIHQSQRQPFQRALPPVELRVVYEHRSEVAADPPLG